MACADVATAKAKAAKAINLIIGFSMLSLGGEKTPSRYARLDASCVGTAPGGKDRREQTTSSARRGGLPMKTMWAVTDTHSAA